MTELTQIRQGLADALSASLGEAFQISPWLLSNPTPPSVQIAPLEIAYHQAMGNGHATWTFRVRVLLPLSTDIGAQQTMDELLGVTGTSLIKEALEAEPTLGGACDDLIVRGADNYQTYVSDNGEMLGADWAVEVWA